MYIDSWDEFEGRAQEMFESAAAEGKSDRVRYTVKYRHCDGKVVLKATDDVVCLKYRTDQVADLKKMEKLNNWFFAWSTGSSLEHVDQSNLPDTSSRGKKSPGRRKR